MAGVLVTLGEKAISDHQNILGSFINIKENLEKSSSYLIESFLSLSKFKRLNEQDTNFFEDEFFFLCVIGTLIYKNSLDREALNLLKIDLLKNDVEELTQYMDGHFALFVIKKNLATLHIITDHAGIIQIYIYQNGNSFIFSSSSMAISRIKPVTINESGVAQFLRNSFVCGSKTIYNEIELLEPATVYSYSIENKPKLRGKKQYWKSPVNVDENIQFQEAALQLSERLNKSLGVFDGKKIICDLTAGYDSRLILSSILSKDSKKLDFETFVYGPETSKEVKLVKSYAKELSIINHHLQLPKNWKDEFPHYSEKALNITDGEDNVFQYAPILYAQYFKKQNFDISVNGLGGELYRDFWWLQEFLYARKPANLSRLIHSRILQYEYDYSIFSEHWKKLLLYLDQIFLNNFQQTIADMDLRNSYNTLQIDNIYFREKIRKWAGRLISSSNQILQTVSPLNFKETLQISMVIPPKIKKRGKIVRAIIESNNNRLAILPLLNGVPAIPMNYKNFYRFIPFYNELLKKGFIKVIQVFTHNTIMLNKNLKYRETYNWKNLLDSDFMKNKVTFENLKSSNLFNNSRFENFINNAKEENFKNYAELGNILSLDFRMSNDNVV